MVFWGWVSWDNFVARLRKTTSGIRWCRICSLSKRGVLTVLSVTLDQIRDDCSRSEDLRANFPMQGPSPFGVQHTQASCPKSCMDYDWNTSTASSGARRSWPAGVWVETAVGRLLCSSGCGSQQGFVTASAKLGPCGTKGIVALACCQGNRWWEQTAQAEFMPTVTKPRKTLRAFSNPDDRTMVATELIPTRPRWSLQRAGACLSIWHKAVTRSVVPGDLQAASLGGSCFQSRNWEPKS